MIFVYLRDFVNTARNGNKAFALRQRQYSFIHVHDAAADDGRGHAAAPQASGLPSLKLRQNIEWVERETIRRALEHAGGVKKEAAEQMGISQRALSYYLAKYRID